jgi:hypothetical protein
LSVSAACASSASDSGLESSHENPAAGRGGVSAGGRSGEFNAGAFGAPQGGNTSVSAGGGGAAGSLPLPSGDVAGAGDERPEAVGGGRSGIIAAGGEGGAAPAAPTQSACRMPVADAVAGGLIVKLKANTNEPSDVTRAEVQITNEGSVDVPLSSLELRYYFESEYDPEQTDKLVVRVDYAAKTGLIYTNVPQQLVSTDVIVVDPPVPGADAYMQITFVDIKGDPGMLLAGETALVQFRVEAPSTWDQTNDYSFGACSQYASPWSRVVLLRDGKVMSGDLPPGLLVRPVGEGGAGGVGGEPGFGGSDALGGAGGFG